MDLIFDESAIVGVWRNANCTPMGDVKACTEAYYDERLSILCVDFSMRPDEEECTWVIFRGRHLETVYGKSRAIRRVIELADSWKREVWDAIPGPFLEETEEKENE